MDDSKQKLFENLKNLSSNSNELLKLSESFETDENEQIIISEDDLIKPEIFVDNSETVKKSKKESTYKKAFDYSIRILSLRDYSTHKMRQKLKEKGFEAEHSEQVIEKLLELNYLRDDEYARMRVKQLIIKGYANSYIIRKVNQEKLSITNEQIDLIRDEQNLGSDSQIRYLIEKKLRNKEVPTDYENKMKLKNKVISFLASKGYNYGQISSVIGEYIS